MQDLLCRKLIVSDDQRNKAKLRYHDQVTINNGGKRYNGRSYNGGKSVLDSMVSEQVVADYYNIPIQDTYDYDFITSNGIRVDLKTKSKSDYEPQRHWYCMVPAYQIDKQQCDQYIFNRINRDLSIVWMVGYISKDNFIKRAMYIEKGETLPDVDGSRDWECWTTGYYLRIDELNEFI